MTDHSELEARLEKATEALWRVSCDFRCKFLHRETQKAVFDALTSITPSPPKGGSIPPCDRGGE